MIFAANLKCNHTRASFRLYSRILNQALKKKNEEIFVFPPSVAFLEDELYFTQGAQNFYPCVNGAFTGEIGKEQLDEFGIKSVLIGHSERRVLGENVEAKFDFAAKQGYTIILCIGESLEVKNSKQTESFLQKQIQKIESNYEKLIIAYEPIYSIGTGMSADLKDIEKILEFIASLSKAKLLYGGSVNENNIKEILGIKHCNGVLVGSAALKAENFLALLSKAHF
ncbi:triose-phosphate isomerase [Campylobacter sp. MIT 21-1685]|uniref:triose-phosphate isomerase n=1 Tax=unclassified Campylobacter TaxID=2593542 RepID=UPI00224A9253|nr:MULTISPECIES: triose-phosphate isomerase [unclassified Campylobacter]MCX2683277.1 triose-phosphate isomerase [Campylobacter sp. MIT 21-1684]MCX2751530.1 triose-phosphate isomerase [Campylobacter sp. MIT 21-1682]MCX2807729.1 triose-phosphate isomerase [Campylobacter sp. MIT 21-1685]